MGFLKGGDVIDCEALVGEDVCFVFRGERFDVGEGDSVFFFVFDTFGVGFRTGFRA